MGGNREDPVSIPTDSSMILASVRYAIRYARRHPRQSLSILSDRINTYLAELAFLRWLQREDIHYTLLEAAPATYPGHQIPVLQGHSCHVFSSLQTIVGPPRLWIDAHSIPAHPFRIVPPSLQDSNSLLICVSVCQESPRELEKNHPALWFAQPAKSARWPERPLRNAFFALLDPDLLDLEIGAEISENRQRILRGQLIPE